jgi:putative ABC transport system permease protein
MNVRSIFTEAFGALNFNRQRSILTTVSLAWGVACFVILYSYGDGFQTALTVAFRAVGQDLVVMFNGQTSSQAGGERAGRSIRLEVADVDAVRDAVPLVAAISPEAMLRNAIVVHQYRQETITVRGVAPTAYQKVRNMTIGSGRWLGGEEDSQKQQVVVLGAKAAANLFGEAPPENEKITINGMTFTVVGVLKSKIQISNYNKPDNECLFIPYQTMGFLKDIRYPSDIAWMPANPIFRKDAVNQVRATLARIHYFSPNDDRAVEIIVFNEFMKQIDGMSIALRVLLGLIGAMTLAIGGVGLTNIMLVAVTQRTKEIGVLKSLGATRNAILMQFLLEAMAIVTLGGLLGVTLGLVFTQGIGTLPFLGPLFKDSTGNGDIHLRISSFAVVTSTVVLEFIGLVSGLLPAIKASRLDPIEALRYE